MPDLVENGRIVDIQCLVSFKLIIFNMLRFVYYSVVNQIF